PGRLLRASLGAARLAVMRLGSMGRRREDVLRFGPGAFPAQRKGLLIPLRRCWAGQPPEHHVEHPLQDLDLRLPGYQSRQRTQVQLTLVAGRATVTARAKRWHRPGSAGTPASRRAAPKRAAMMARSSVI